MWLKGGANWIGDWAFDGSRQLPYWSHSGLVSEAPIHPKRQLMRRMISINDIIFVNCNFL